MQVSKPATLAEFRDKLRAHLPAAETTWRPLVFPACQAESRNELLELLTEDRSSIQVFDKLLEQVRDLVRTRHPERKLTAAEVESLTKDFLGGVSGEEYGVWVYYPWSGRLVHLLDRADFIELRTNRNHYKITREEQLALSTRRIGVIGLSAGQSAALTLAQERSCGELRLADFDALDLSNLNRIRSGVHNLGVPKVFVTAREIGEIDPYLRVTIEGGKLDIVVEECDSLDIKVIVRDHARRQGIPVLMHTSDRGMLDIERYDLEPALPILHGLLGDIAPASLRDLTLEQKIPYVLQSIGVDGISSRMRASLIEIEQSILTWPQLATEVVHGGAALAETARRICLGEPVTSGRYYLESTPGIAAGTEGDDHSTPKTGDVRPRALQLHELAPCVAQLRVRLPASVPSAIRKDQLRRLVEDASLAPSGGNCQPWKWAAESGELYLFHDRSLSYAVFDENCLGGWLALGACAENLVLSAHAAGLEVTCEWFPSDEAPDLAARFRFGYATDEFSEPHWRDELYSTIKMRRTNRKVCPRSPIRLDGLDKLSQAVRSVEGADVHWLLKDDELEECGELIGAGDRLLFLTQALHAFLMGELRWTDEQRDATRDGIPLETLELSASDRAALQVCRDWDAMRLVSLLSGGRNLEKSGRRAVSSASAVGLITMPSVAPSSYLRGGRAVERVWLAATELGIALHPMTALPYLFAQPSDSSLLAIASDNLYVLRKLEIRYRRLFPLPPNCAHIFLFRLSNATETHTRCLRHVLENVLIEHAYS